MSIQIFSTRIAHGYSAEARVFAHLLEHRSPAVRARVAMQRNGDPESYDNFAQVSRCEMAPVETGWRYTPDDARRGLPARIAFRARLLQAKPKILNLARECKPDVIYSAQQHYDLVAASYVADKLKLPQMIHLHYLIGPWLKKHALSRLLTCDHVICVSDFIRGEALKHGVPEEKLTVVHNALDLWPLLGAAEASDARQDLGVPQNAFLFGNVSRLDHGKGQPEAIAAFAKIAASRPDAWLVIIGIGGCEQELKAQAAATGVRDRILFTGLRDDVPRLLSAMDCFIHPSYGEPFSLAILEAMISGLPLIAFNEGGPMEIIVDGQTGYLTPAGDVNHLADAMSILHDNPEQARAFGSAGRERAAANFSPEQASRKFEQALCKVAQ